MMQAPPDDLFQQDLNSFPTADPATMEAQRKQIAQVEKERKAREAQEKREAAAEQKRVKQSLDKPVIAAKAQTAAETQLKLHKIRLYFTHFGERLSMKHPKTLPKEPAEVNELLESIELELQSTGGIEQAAAGYQSILGGMEILHHRFNPLGLQLSGPAASLAMTVQQNREKWNDLVTEFAIAHAEWFMVSDILDLTCSSTSLDVGTVFCVC